MRRQQAASDKQRMEKLADSLQPYFNYTTILSCVSKEELGNYCERILDRMKKEEEKKEYLALKTA